MKSQILTEPFIIYGTPRSRTYWLSRYLTYADWHTGHDEIIHARTLDDVTSWFNQPCTGTVETAAAPFWRMIPHVKALIIRRPIDDVIDSLMKTANFDKPSLTRMMDRLDHKLDQIEKRLGVQSIPYDELKSEQTCKQIFEYCLPYQHDRKWWKKLRNLNLQISMPQLMRYMNAYQPQMSKLSQIAKHHMLVGITRDIPLSDKDGLSVQQESFETFFRDGQSLFAEHLVLVGEGPGDFTLKNLDLMREMEQAGRLQITTGRCNGRMFGYLMATIGPSLEAPDRVSAAHTINFASPDMPGLGMKMQRASIEALRNQGVDEIFLHAGVRGSGPRMGTLFKRLGASEFGGLYRLELNQAAA